MTNQWGLQVFHFKRKLLKSIVRDINKIYLRKYFNYFLSKIIDRYKEELGIGS